MKVLVALALTLSICLPTAHAAFDQREAIWEMEMQFQTFNTTWLEWQHDVAAGTMTNLEFSQQSCEMLPVVPKLMSLYKYDVFIGRYGTAKVFLDAAAQYTLSRWGYECGSQRFHTKLALQNTARFCAKMTGYITGDIRVAEQWVPLP